MEQLRAARGGGVKVVMVHENDAARGGCAFAIFFDGRTPEVLKGLYDALALALYSGPFWPVSVALVAKALPHPISGEPITGPFYDAGTTWDSTFGKIASTCVCQRSISSSLGCRLVCVYGSRQRNPVVLASSPW